MFLILIHRNVALEIFLLLLSTISNERYSLMQT
nr:MAG TPA: hypothetical protein [Caudoviricetes sp.]